MSDAPLPTDFMISAQIRIAAREGVPIVVRQRGDNNLGTITLKINLLNGLARVLTQARLDDEIVWNPVSRTDPMNDADAEIYLERQSKFDPDSWVIEIEDKQGRHWFPGRIVTF